MRVNDALALTGACHHVASAAPAAPEATGVNYIGPRMRLIQTSENDLGTWMDEDEEFDKFISKNIGFVDVTDSDQNNKPALASRQGVSYPDKVGHMDEANKLNSQVSIDKPKEWLDKFSNFHTRHFRTPTGKEAATWLFEEVKKVAAANPVITVRQFVHRGFDQPSVIAQIPGNSQDLVILGSHLDSESGRGPNTRFPGADDNGSGTVVVLEALRVMAETVYKPQNTLEFHFYAAEEAGLRGSGDVYRDYKASGKRVLAMLQQDMTGYSPRGRMSVITDFVDPALTEFVKVVAMAYSDEAPTTSECGYGCSDYYSAISNGFRVLVFEEKFGIHNPFIHSPEDTIDKIQWSSVLRHAKFSVGFMVEAS